MPGTRQLEYQHPISLAQIRTQRDQQTSEQTLAQFAQFDRLRIRNAYRLPPISRAIGADELRKRRVQQRIGDHLLQSRSGEEPPSAQLVADAAAGRAWCW